MEASSDAKMQPRPVLRVGVEIFAMLVGLIEIGGGESVGGQLGHPIGNLHPFIS